MRRTANHIINKSTSKGHKLIELIGVNNSRAHIIAMECGSVFAILPVDSYARVVSIECISVVYVDGGESVIALHRSIRKR